MADFYQRWHQDYEQNQRWEYMRLLSRWMVGLLSFDSRCGRPKMRNSVLELRDRKLDDIQLDKLVIVFSRWVMLEEINLKSFLIIIKLIIVEGLKRPWDTRPLTTRPRPIGTRPRPSPTRPRPRPQILVSRLRSCLETLHPWYYATTASVIIHCVKVPPWHSFHCHYVTARS